MTKQPDRPQVSPRLLSIDDAAACMSISPQVVRKLIGDGRLPCVRIGDRPLVPVAAIDWFIDEYAELGDEIWRHAIEKAVASAADAVTEKGRSTADRTASGSHKQLSIVDANRG